MFNIKTRDHKQSMVINALIWQIAIQQWLHLLLYSPSLSQFSTDRYLLGDEHHMVDILLIN